MYYHCRIIVLSTFTIYHLYRYYVIELFLSVFIDLFICFLSIAVYLVLYHWKILDMYVERRPIRPTSTEHLVALSSGSFLSIVTFATFLYIHLRAFYYYTDLLL